MNGNVHMGIGSNRNLFLLLALVILTGCILRVASLDGESLWNDELSSWYRSSFSSISEVISMGVIPDVHPPGYQILLYSVEQTIGDSETALRLPSAIAGILTIPMIFLLGKRLLSNSAGLLASALLAVSPVHIWFSQEARAYAILILLVTVSVYFFIDILRKLAAGEYFGKFTVAGFIMTGVLLEYTHYFGLLILTLEIASLLIISLILSRDRLKTLVISLIPILMFMPWVPYAIAQSGRESYITVPTVRSVIMLFFEFMSWSKVMLVLLCLMVSTGFIVYMHKSRKGSHLSFTRGNLLIILLWLLLPLASSLLLSFSLTPVFTIRNMLVALPAVLLILSASIHIVFRSGWLRYTIGTVLCFYLLFSLFFVRKHYSIPHRQQFREVSQYVVNNCNNRDEVLILASSWNNLYFDYYLNQFSNEISVDLHAADISDFPAVADLILSRRPQQLWLLWGHLEPDSALIDSISCFFDEFEYYQFLESGIWLFK